MSNNNMMQTSAAEMRKKLLSELEGASPLDTFSILERVEMCDAKDAREIIDEVYAQFESGEQRVETIVVPVFTSIVDGLMADGKVGDELKKKGLSATRIVTECQNFQYEGGDSRGEVYSEVEKNRIIGEKDTSINDKLEHRVNQQYYRKRETAEAHGDTYYNYSYTKNQKDDVIRRNKDENRGKNDETDGKELRDGYTGKMLYEKRDDAKNADGSWANAAEVDHVIPLEQVHTQLKNNCMLTNEDVRKIANIDDNFVVTSHEINDSKKSKTNTEYVEANKDTLDKETQKRMLEAEKEAQKAIDREANKTVLNNMMDKEMRGKLGKEMQNVGKDAAKDGAQFGVGNLLVEIVKPLYYEIKDVFINGMKEGVGASSAGEAFKIRLNRVKNHVMSAFLKVGATSILDIIKAIISAVVGAIIDLFFGLVKQILTLIKRGFPVVVSAIKVLSDPKKSASEKGDAIVKLLGGLIISVVGGIIVSKLDGLDKLSPGLKNIIGALITGCGTLIFMSLLDKLDLFSTKAEKRAARIKEIFDARIADMEERAACMRVEVIELLGKQRRCFDALISGMETAIDSENVEDMVQYSYSLADFFKVELEYSNTEEFVKWWDSQKVIKV